MDLLKLQDAGHKLKAEGYDLLLLIIYTN